jgi:hypothetical protein
MLALSAYDPAVVAIPARPYATGETLQQLLAEGWTITGSERELIGRALLYWVSLRAGNQTITLAILDGPVVRNAVRPHLA